MTAALDEVDGTGLEHEAFFYGSDAQYAATLAPLLGGAVGAGEEVVAVVPRRNAALLRAELGPAATHVRWVAAEDWYLHPVRTIAAYDRLLRALPPGANAFVVGQVQFGDTAPAWRDWTRYEAALNRALDRYPVRVICPYDERSLPPSVVAGAERTHPHLLRAHESCQPSARYVEPEALLPSLSPVPPLPDGRASLEVSPADSVRAGRRAFADAARRWGLAGDRVRELAVAVSEVLTNAMVHGGGEVSLRVWTDDDSLTCVVEDSGRGADDPLLGLRPPPPGSPRGYGLWYVRQVFDRTEMTRSPLGGLRVCMVVDRRA